eukprot:TRINITY_DN1236_c0_g1_i1.p1 TRINITY_DN1236_c0_g1~~TRINITY_DN1236_c0_g1_i1.p1  ORF type:complete len:244 (+),score=27.70 TRINITY_DN1236_c0_g1_i1:50-733(+)
MSSLDTSSFQLLQEISRVSDSSIPQFNLEGVRQIIQNVNEHFQAMKGIHEELSQDESQNRQNEASGTQSSEQSINWSDHPQQASAFIVHHSAIVRSKQTLCVYVNERLKLLRALQWQHRKPPQEINEEMKTKMSAEERLFCDAYKAAMDKYTNSIGLDLTLQLEPPKHTMVEVRGKQKYGVWRSEQRSFHIEEGSTHLMSLEDAEQLMRDSIVSPLAKKARIVGRKL